MACQGHTERRWQSWDLDMRLFYSKARTLSVWHSLPEEPDGRPRTGTECRAHARIGGRTYDLSSSWLHCPSGSAFSVTGEEAVAH